MNKCFLKNCDVKACLFMLYSFHVCFLNPLADYPWPLLWQDVPCLHIFNYCLVSKHFLLRCAVSCKSDCGRQCTSELEISFRLLLFPTHCKSSVQMTAGTSSSDSISWSSYLYRLYLLRVLSLSVLMEFDLLDMSVCAVLDLGAYIRRLQLHFKYKFFIWSILVQVNWAIIIKVRICTPMLNCVCICVIW